MLETADKKRPKPPGGSRKGKPNKTTAAIKDMIDQALREAGGVDYLKRQAEENPSAFMGLIGKILPKDVNLGGQIDNPVRITEIALTALESDNSATS